MASEKCQRLLNAFANELEDIGVRVTHLAKSGAREPFDVQYWDLDEPPAIDGKAPDLQGQRWGSTHIGKVDTSAPDLRIMPRLDTFLHHVRGDPSVSLHVATLFEYKIVMKDTILQLAGRNTPHKIWVWPFRESGQTYTPEPKLRVG